MEVPTQSTCSAPVRASGRSCRRDIADNRSRPCSAASCFSAPDEIGAEHAIVAAHRFGRRIKIAPVARQAVRADQHARIVGIAPCSVGDAVKTAFGSSREHMIHAFVFFQLGRAAGSIGMRFRGRLAQVGREHGEYFHLPGADGDPKSLVPPVRARGRFHGRPHGRQNLPAVRRGAAQAHLLNHVLARSEAASAYSTSGHLWVRERQEHYVPNGTVAARRAQRRQ